MANRSIKYENIDNRDDLYVHMYIYGNLLSNQIFYNFFLRIKQNLTIHFLGGVTEPVFNKTAYILFTI